jgi:hypothetical protein
VNKSHVALLKNRSLRKLWSEANELHETRLRCADDVDWETVEVEQVGYMDRSRWM